MVSARIKYPAEGEPGDPILLVSAPWSPGRCGAKHRAIGRYRQAKETKRGGMGGGKSERLSSTDEAGELSPGGPGVGKAGAGSMEPLKGKNADTRDELEDLLAFLDRL